MELVIRGILLSTTTFSQVAQLHDAVTADCLPFGGDKQFTHTVNRKKKRSLSKISQ